MNFLPDNFPINSLTSVEEQKVQWFYRRFVEEFGSLYGRGHFLLAAYAAVPRFLTPDLLYKLWQNFNAYRWMGEPKSVNRIAVSDILLSPLCQEVGLELYEMHSEIRMAFLEWLHKESNSDIGKKRGVRQIEEVALFVEQYNATASVEGTRWGKSYKDAQETEAISYSDPARAAKLLFEELGKAIGQTEQLRTMSKLVLTRQRLERISLKDKLDDALLSNHQADLMNAWSSLIQRDHTNFLNQLKRNPGLLNLLRDTGGSGIEITMNEGAVERVNLVEKRKLRCLLVGGGGADSFNIQLMRDALIKSAPSEQLEIVVVEYGSSEQVLTALNSLVSEGVYADLLLYISAVDLERYVGLDVKQIGAVLEKAGSASLTVIVDLFEKVSPREWINVTDSRKLLLWMDDEGGTLHHQDMFTTAVARCMVQFGLNHSNRNFFLRTLEIYRELLPAKAIEDRSAPMPQIYADVPMMNRFFLQGRNDLIELQWQLRRNGYYDGVLTGEWGKDTAQALEEFRRNYPNGVEKTKRDYINSLSDACQQKRKTAKPVWLLIFSNPGKVLKELLAEKEAILRMVRPTRKELNVDIVLLENPDAGKIYEALSKSEYRNRIEFIYYSGLDQHGEMLLSDGVFPFFKMAKLFGFQEHIFLFAANTCRSAQMASQMLQMGVAHAIGGAEDISDVYGKGFGIELFQHIVGNRGLSRIPSLRTVSPGDLEKFREVKDQFFLFHHDTVNPEEPWPVSWHRPAKDTFVQGEQPIEWWSITVTTGPGNEHPRSYTYMYKGHQGEMNQFTVDVPPNVLQITSTALSKMRDEKEVLDGMFDVLLPQQLKKDIEYMPNLVWTLDKESALCPWEMLSNPVVGGVPLAVEVQMLRNMKVDALQFPKPKWVNDVLLVVDPDTQKRMPALAGAYEEGQKLAQLFESSGLPVTLQSRTGEKQVKKAAFSRPFRIVHFGGHAHYDEKDIDKSGLIIGPDKLFTLSELAKMEQVAELVFLNCVIPTQFAAYIAQNLLMIGVSVVVVAAGAVDDLAAFTFAESFYTGLLNGNNLGQSMMEARIATRTRHERNAGWAVYQCYGDPAYTIYKKETRKKGPAMPKVKPMSRVQFETHVQSVYNSVPIVVADDTQKGRWGGEAESSGRRMSAKVTKDGEDGFSVTLRIESTAPAAPLIGRAAFFLDGSFNSQIEYRTLRNNGFTLKVYASEAFTVGALLEDGTRLELDLQQVLGFPEDFYYHEPSPGFRRQVEEVLQARPVILPDDTQKERWGGRAEAGDKRIEAKVVRNRRTEIYDITITIHDKSGAVQECAIFLDSTYSAQVRYLLFEKGKAQLEIDGYEASTIGAFLDDGTMLELDLQQVKGWPEY